MKTKLAWIFVRVIAFAFLWTAGWKVVLAVVLLFVSHEIEMHHKEGDVK